MLSYKLIEKRHSVREYKKKQLAESDRNTIKMLSDEYPGFIGDPNLEVVFIENGFDLAEKLEGYAGYFGKMIVAPHYFALVCSENSSCRKTAGYVGEWLVLSALKHDIGSCWIEVLDSINVKRIMGMESDKEVVALIAIGYPKKEHQMSSIYANTGRGSLSSLTDMGYPNMNTDFSKGPTRERKTIAEYVYFKDWGVVPDINDLERMGIHEALYYMRLAPSYENRQPWIFFIKDIYVDLIVEKTDHASEAVQCLDAGIAMFYLEVGLHDSGFRGRWELNDVELDYSLNDKQKFVGRYRFE